MQKKIPQKSCLSWMENGRPGFSIFGIQRRSEAKSIGHRKIFRRSDAKMRSYVKQDAYCIALVSLPFLSAGEDFDGVHVQKENHTQRGSIKLSQRLKP